MYSNLELPQYLELGGSLLSLILNIILLFIIKKFSRPEYGSYRILMLVMTSLYVIYSAIEVLVLPSYFVFEYNYFLFTTYLTQYRKLSQILIVTFCSIFGCMQVVLASQFIYRFLSVANNNYIRDKFFKGRRHLVWIIITVLFFLNWYTVAWFVFGNRGYYPKELEESVSERFGRNITGMAFTLVTYAQKDENGAVRINFLKIAMISYLLICASIPMAISLTCGVKTWLKIQSTISLVQQSFQLQKQERQLFFALLTQFTIPFLGNTLPMLVLFLCPAVHVSTEPYTNYICMLIPFYPAFDALATTFIIKDYYRGILRIIGAYRFVHTTSITNSLRVPPNSLHTRSISNMEFSRVANYI